ncbi:hypothetical protein Tco_0601804 [Tanacetum coccineum]
MKGGLKWSASAILFRGQILDKFWTLWITEFHKSVFRKRFLNVLFTFTYRSEVEALVQKLIDEDNGRQNAILDLALQFETSCIAKDDLRKAFEKCNDISQESRALIDSFLKEGSDKDYELNLYMYGKAAKLEKHKDAKLVWLLKKYYYRSQESVEEQAMDAKAREEKIRQKQADDDEFFLTFGRVRIDSDYESSD